MNKRISKYVNIKMNYLVEEVRSSLIEVYTDKFNDYISEGYTEKEAMIKVLNQINAESFNDIDSEKELIQSDKKVSKLLWVNLGVFVFIQVLSFVLYIIIMNENKGKLDFINMFKEYMWIFIVHASFSFVALLFQFIQNTTHKKAILSNSYLHVVRISRLLFLANIIFFLSFYLTIYDSVPFNLNSYNYVNFFVDSIYAVLFISLINYLVLKKNFINKSFLKIVISLVIANSLKYFFSFTSMEIDYQNFLGYIIMFLYLYSFVVIVKLMLYYLKTLKDDFPLKLILIGNLIIYIFLNCVDIWWENFSFLTLENVNTLNMLLSWIGILSLIIYLSILGFMKKLTKNHFLILFFYYMLVTLNLTIFGNILINGFIKNNLFAIDSFINLSGYTILSLFIASIYLFIHYLIESIKNNNKECEEIN